MSKPLAGERLAQAAFALFDERGYEQTTIDDIAERAGLSRATFFRHYRSKEDVIFPDHDRLLRQVRDRLRSSSHGTALAAVSDAVRLVLVHYLAEGEVARRRYALTSTVPALRDREIVSVARYQRLFREFITEWMADRTSPRRCRPSSWRPLLSRRTTTCCAAGCAARALTRSGKWTMPCARSSPCSRRRPPARSRHGTTIVAFRTGQRLETLLPAIQQLLEA